MSDFPFVVVSLAAKIEALSWLDKILGVSSGIITIMVLILGFKLFPRIKEKLTGKSLKYTVIIGIMSVISIPLVF